MKAARGPYSDPRDTYIMREIRWAFESLREGPYRRSYVGEKVFGWQLRLNGKPKRCHYQSIRRALRKVATPIGRASTGAARCYGSRMSEWVCAIVRVINNGGRQRIDGALNAQSASLRRWKWPPLRT